MNSFSKSVVVLLVALGVLGFFVYFPGINIPYFADDFQFLSDFSCSDFSRHFTQRHPRISFYRPIETAFLACVQDHFGLSTVPIHLATIFLHSLVSVLVFIGILKLGFSHVQAVLGFLFMLLSQANASAVLGNDTLSQVSGTFFGCLSLWLLYASFPGSQAVEAGSRMIGDFRNYSLSIFAFALALLSKESSASFFPLLLSVIYFRFIGFKRKSALNPLKQTFLASLPFILVFVAYLTVRWLIGVNQPSFGSTRYNFRIGFNLLENYGLLLFALFIPGSSVTAFTSMQSGELVTFAAISIATILFIILLASGLYRSYRRSTICALAVFSIVALMPMAMMNHVSELYAYNSMPFVSAIAGVSLGTLFAHSKTGHAKYAVVIMIVVLLTSHIMAVREKAFAMDKNGRRATMLLNGIQPYARLMPQNGELLLLNRHDDLPQYSIFLMRDFNVLRFGEWRVKKSSHRDDIKVKIIEQKDFEPEQNKIRNRLVLYLDGDSIKVYQGNTKANSAS